MPITFETFGPFSLDRRNGVDRDALDTFWGQEEIPATLCFESGVYIICTKHGSTIKPWYVGQTHGRFESRLNQHSTSRTFERIAELSPKGPLQLFLIARRTSSGKPIKSTKRKSRGIRYVEAALIGACLTVNSDLINVSQATFFEGMHVPGLRSSKPGKPTASAINLRKMLSSRK